MVKYIDIIEAINIKLKSKFNNIIITTEGNVKEKITRPSFFVQLDDIKASDFTNEALDREMVIRIFYYPKEPDKNRVENLNVLDQLNDLFINNNLIKINDELTIEVWDEVEANIIEKVVHYYIPLMLSEDYNRVENTPFMEELEVN